MPGGGQLDRNLGQVAEAASRGPGATATIGLARRIAIRKNARAGHRSAGHSTSSGAGTLPFSSRSAAGDR
jgi:hypothetical protein